MLQTIELLGGLALFLFGMNSLSSGLEKLAGGKMQGLLNRVTKNPFIGLGIGLGVTMVIQSSSAFTVMLVGLVNSGIMSLTAAIPMIFGSEIGTTFTAWILALNGIDAGTSVFAELLKPRYFSLIFGCIGMLMLFTSKRGKKHDLGMILIGFAILMNGMNMMSDAMSVLKDSDAFAQLLALLSNPIVALLAGILFTSIIQSSSAAIGILQAIVVTGSDTVTLGMALPLIFGINIGTCITGVLASIGVSKDAKRVSIIHMLISIFGAAMGLAVLLILNYAVHLEALQFGVDALGIAVAHTSFNVAKTFVLFPARKLISDLAMKILPDSADDSKVMLDDLLLNTPAVAVSECNKYAIKMCQTAEEAILTALSLTRKYDNKTAEHVLSLEDKLDKYEDELGSFLVKLSAEDISEDDSKTVSKILHSIGNFERIGDHAVNMLDVAEEMHEKKVTFSPEGQAEMSAITEALTEILHISTDAFCSGDIVGATRVEPLEQVIDDLIERSRINHIDRLTRGICTIQHGFVHSDLLNNYERVSDHCSNIAVAIIEIGHNSFETHEYLHEYKSQNNAIFNEYFNEYKQKYTF